MKRLADSRILVLVLVLVTIVPATAVAQQGNNAHVGSNWSRTELFFGTAIKGGGVVTDEQFRAFLDSEITPRFPEGLTVLTGRSAASFSSFCTRCRLRTATGRLKKSASSTKPDSIRSPCSVRILTTRSLSKRRCQLRGTLKR